MLKLLLHGESKMAKIPTVKLSADKSLTSEAFSFNSDGSVTVKNAELSKMLKENLNKAVSAPDTEAAVGLIWT